ncbi:MAG: hypothetical protein NZ608_07310 [candidate division WOR-3 bacterium]|nr:hypothetical protein [candidate division WOR-3 bacterium]
MKTLIAIILFFIFNISFSRFRFPPNVTYPGKLELNHQTGDVLCICPRIDAECYCVFREDPAETYIGEDNNYLYFKAKVEIINEKINFITDATGNRLIAFEKSKIEEGSKREKDFLAADTSRRRNQPGMLFYEPLTGTFWCFCPDPIATCRCIYAPGTPDFVNSFVGEDERGKIYRAVRNGKIFLVSPEGTDFVIISE